MTEHQGRRWPIGAEIAPGGVHFRVWAPERRSVAVVIDGRDIPLEREPSGYWSGLVRDARAGTRYAFRLDDGATAFPDPASKFQPDGPHAASEVVDPEFQWTDAGWRGIERVGQVIYELHIGTFTPEGTWSAAAAKLSYLRNTGITTIEVMPVSDFPGNFGWGYDGVHHYAPTRLYGRPEDFRAFVNRAHSIGLAVILDVVYNHFGPDGNYLGQFSIHYFTERHNTDWGAAINFDSDDCQPVREFFIHNAAYWIEEFHLDGFRFDATDSIYDDSEVHVLAEIVRESRRVAPGRSLFFVAENDSQETRLVRDHGFDALWNDDYHHTAMVAMSGRAEAYYMDYRGTPQEFISAAKYGYLFQGQWHQWQRGPRGSSTFGLPPSAFVRFLDNHDQVSNSVRGLRAKQTTDPGTHRALTALTLLGPGTPMLFQGQEFGATTPFYFFADHEAGLARLVEEGRAGFMGQFAAVATGEMREYLPDPADPKTFRRSKLDWSECERNREEYAMIVDLLRLRREDPVFASQRPGGVDGAVLGDRAFVLRFFGEQNPGGAADRLLVVNLGADMHYAPAPEPLLAPPAGTQWSLLWSSENPKYGGRGTPPLDAGRSWRIPGRAAVVLAI